MNNEKYENYKNISNKGTAKRSNKLREGMIKIHSLNIILHVWGGQERSNVIKCIKKPVGLYWFWSYADRILSPHN